MAKYLFEAHYTAEGAKGIARLTNARGFRDERSLAADLSAPERLVAGVLDGV